ncbi:MAG: hypothetical protein ACTSWK_16785 [Promethearchaeota archaeon]
MKKPEIVIIDDEPTARSFLKDAFKTIVRKETGIEFDVRAYDQCPKDIKEITNASILFIDYFLSGKNGQEIARELVESESQGERVMITGNPDEAIKKMVGSGKRAISRIFDTSIESKAIQAWQNFGGHELFPKIWGKPIDAKKLTDLVTELRDKQGIRIPLSLGVVGLGRLGRETVERASTAPWISQIGVFSEFLNDHPDEYKMYPKIIGGDVTPHKRLEGLLESNPDILFIATGIRSEEIIPRNKMFEPTAERVYPILKTIRDSGYKNPIIIGSNPIEPLIKLAHDIGIDPRQLIGESVTDTLRTRRMLVEGSYLPKNGIRIYDIDIDVLGSHSRPVPIFSGATIKGKKIESYAEFREKFTRELRKMGGKIMRGARAIGSYSDAPNAVMEILWDFSTLSRRPRSCWSMYDFKTSYSVTNVPVDITYSDSPKLSIASPPELDDWERTELEKQERNSRTQRNSVEKFLRKK